jgi:hypothetical protein
MPARERRTIRCMIGDNSDRNSAPLSPTSLPSVIPSRDTKMGVHLRGRDRGNEDLVGLHPTPLLTLKVLLVAPHRVANYLSRLWSAYNQLIMSHCRYA